MDGLVLVLSISVVLVNTDNKESYGKTQITTSHFHMQLHASNFGIHFLSLP